MRNSLLIFLFVVTSSCEKNSGNIATAPVNSAKTQIATITGDDCPIFEEDLFKIPYKEIFSDCDLRGNPKLFDGKLVRIKARYGFMIHGNYLSGNPCTELSDSVHDSISPQFESELAFDYLRGLKANPINIVAVGRFSLVEPTKRSDTIYDHTPFHFSLVCLEKASAVTSSK